MSIFVNLKKSVKTNIPLMSILAATSCFSMDDYKSNSNPNFYIDAKGTVIHIPSTEKISAQYIEQQKVLGMFEIQLNEGNVEVNFNNRTNCTANLHSYTFTDGDINLNDHVELPPIVTSSHQKDTLVMKKYNQKAMITFIDDNYESKSKTFELYFYKSSRFRFLANPLQSLTGYGKSTFIKNHGWMLYATEVQANTQEKTQIVNEPLDDEDEFFSHSSDSSSD